MSLFQLWEQNHLHAGSAKHIKQESSWGLFHTGQKYSPQIFPQLSSALLGKCKIYQPPGTEGSPSGPDAFIASSQPLPFSGPLRQYCDGQFYYKGKWLSCISGELTPQMFITGSNSYTRPKGQNCCLKMVSNGFQSFHWLLKHSSSFLSERVLCLKWNVRFGILQLRDLDFSSWIVEQQSFIFIYPECIYGS